MVINRTGRHLPYEVAVLARIGGRYQPSRRAAPRRGQHQDVAISRTGRDLPYEVAALARVGARYQPCPGGHACLSAVMPAAAACENPWRRANTLHTFVRRRTQGRRR